MYKKKNNAWYISDISHHVAPFLWVPWSFWSTRLLGLCSPETARLGELGEVGQQGLYVCWHLRYAVAVKLRSPWDVQREITLQMTNIIKQVVNVVLIKILYKTSEDPAWIPESCWHKDSNFIMSAFACFCQVHRTGCSPFKQSFRRSALPGALDTAKFMFLLLRRPFPLTLSLWSGSPPPRCKKSSRLHHSQSRVNMTSSNKRQLLGWQINHVESCWITSSRPWTLYPVQLQGSGHRYLLDFRSFVLFPYRNDLCTPNFIATSRRRSAAAHFFAFCGFCLGFDWLESFSRSLLLSLSFSFLGREQSRVNMSQPSKPKWDFGPRPENTNTYKYYAHPFPQYTSLWP